MLIVLSMLQMVCPYDTIHVTSYMYLQLFYRCSYWLFMLEFFRDGSDGAKLDHLMKLNIVCKPINYSQRGDCELAI